MNTDPDGEMTGADWEPPTALSPEPQLLQEALPHQPLPAPDEPYKGYLLHLIETKRVRRD